MVIYKVTLTDGLDFLEYNIYYNNIVTNIPQLYDITTSGTTGPATNIPYLTLRNGVYVEVPDATSVINIVTTAPYCDYVFSECVRLECCGITPTPTPTFTPSPTPTPTVQPPTNDCVECVDAYYNTLYQECGGYSYPLIQHRVCCTYLNSTGGTKNAPSNVTITQKALTVGCGGSGDYYFDVIIPSGSTSGCTIYTAQSTDLCGDYGCVITDHYWQDFIIPSNLCQTITPTPTPTVTSTRTPTPTPSSTVGPLTPTPTNTLTSTPTGTPTPTPSSTPQVYTYVAGCSGGTILGYILGSYSSSLQFTATDTNCYVTAYTTVSPSIGSLLTVSSWGTCCPTPTPTPDPGVGFGIYTGSTFATSTLCCADTNYPSITRYLNADSTPNISDVFYNTAACTPGDVFVGNSNWYNVRKDSNKWAIQIGSSGTILDIVDCNSVTPTPTPTGTPTSTPTPTPSSTSTPTPTPSPTTSYELYTADRYECDSPSGPCSYVETIQIANPVVMIGGKFYLDNINGYILNVSGTGTGGPYLYTDCSGLGTNNCSSLCGV